MAATTIIRVARPDGTIDAIERSGHITHRPARLAMETATREAGRGEIIGWELRGSERAMGSQRTANRGLYARGQARCRGCGRVGDDGACGLG